MIRPKGNRTRQKNKRGDSKVESNDSPEIPDRGETSDIPALLSGAILIQRTKAINTAQQTGDTTTETFTTYSNFNLGCE